MVQRQDREVVGQNLDYFLMRPRLHRMRCWDYLFQVVLGQIAVVELGTGEGQPWMSRGGWAYQKLVWVQGKIPPRSVIVVPPVI